jgi:hypothetical protein
LRFFVERELALIVGCSIGDGWVRVRRTCVDCDLSGATFRRESLLDANPSALSASVSFGPQPLRSWTFQSEPAAGETSNRQETA